MKLGFKIAAVILFFTLSTSLTFYLIGWRNQQKNYVNLSHDQIRHAQLSFNMLAERDVQKLSAALEVIVQDPVLKDRYSHKDRDELYHYTLPLFEKLRKRYNITHFYFILPDGHVFLRMHSRAIYGDLVERKSFQKARDSQDRGWEMELGKTAFALRTVMPYYDGRTLIGYVELAEEIDQFLAVLKNGTSNEFGMIGDKTLLDKAEWQTMRRNDGLKDNWSELENHVILGRTSEFGITASCFQEENVILLENGQTVLRQLRSGDREFMCGGFDLRDASGGHIGAVLSLIDMSNNVIATQKANRSMLLLAGFLFVANFAGGVLYSRSFTRPLANLTLAANEMAQGNMDHHVVVDRADEIGRLGRAFNTMIDKRKQADADLQRSLDNLERTVEERTRELITANRRLQDLSAHLQNAAEDDRKRIAREIHDELGQSLTAMKMELALLRKALPGSETLSIAKAESLHQLVEATSESVKRISMELRPGILDHLGLTAAIEWQAGEFEKRTGICCSVSIEAGDVVPDEDRATAVFRIFQEMLTNVARHAEAANVNALLRMAEGTLVLQVEDDGRGMSDEQYSSRKSYGIVGMRERVHGWGGELMIESVERRGTKVTVRLPLTSEGAQS